MNTGRQAIVAAFLALALLAAAPQALAQKPGRSGDPGRCKEGSSVIVEVEGVKLRVPRSPLIYATLADGKTMMGLGRAVKGYDCSTPAILGAHGLSSREFTIGEAATRSASREHFESMRVLVLEFTASKRTIAEKLPGGVKKLTHPGANYEIMLLPQDEAPTADREPVAIFCAAAVKGKLAEVIPQPCDIFYIHPSGLRFSYTLLRAQLPDDQILAIDARKRKILEDMIANARVLDIGQGD
jgi:hypothetical protein